jgi:hypothetical protein
MVILPLESLPGLAVGVDIMGVPVTSAKRATFASLDHVTGRQSSAMDKLGRQDKVKESAKIVCILNDNIFGVRVTRLLGLGSMR